MALPGVRRVCARTREPEGSSCPPRHCKPPLCPDHAAAGPPWPLHGLAGARAYEIGPDRPWPLLTCARSRPSQGGALLAWTSNRSHVAPLPSRRRCAVATPTPRCCVRGVASLLCTHKTQTRTHALEFTPDQEEAAWDPGDADTWAQAISRGKEKRKEKRRSRAEFGLEGPRRREAHEDFRPDNARFSFCFSRH
mgnify:CR=1 FL=1